MSHWNLESIGNGTIGCLLNARAEIVWGCFPRFDADPAFCSLLRARGADQDFGFFAIDLIDHVREEQDYLPNTPILVTRLFDDEGGCVEVTDFAPRFRQFGRVYSPMMVVRQIRRVAGNPRVRICLRPAHSYGRHRSDTTSGSNHIRYVGADLVLRLTTDASITALLEETPFLVDDAMTFILGADETVQGSVSDVGLRLLEETLGYWRDWVRNLAIPFEWQDAVIRAAITLKLNVFEDTGAIIAAMTTSIPESAGSIRNWDYRHCWLRDAYFVVNELNRLGATRTMERHLRYILNIIASAKETGLRPMYGINGQVAIDEREVDSLPGYRGMGPVRVGNQAHRQLQHDVYGAAILAATHMFFDHRLPRRGDTALFERLETLGEQAALLYDKPDAGIWELRGVMRVHTFSSMMCWAACDRLARIATALGLTGRAEYWQNHATTIHRAICERSWNPAMGCFVGTMDGDTLDASLLRMHEIGFLAADDPRFIGTVDAVERGLRRGNFVFRYVEKDDFGEPENAFLICTFWYINALAAIGRRDEARTLFENMLSCRNRHGLLAEHIDPHTNEQWGNFVQTYSMVGLIASAIRLSVRWDQAF
ncbi:MAG: glycoside hydrolase family 15 protein [Vicinamibacterales bacterium]